MIEGWLNDDYLILFEEQAEAIRMTEAYGISEYIPGHTLVGLRSWDDFILSDMRQQFFLIPTVPLEPTHLEPYSFSFDLASLKPDEKLQKKIKWYIKPILFGGAPEEKENMTWISLEQHIELVRWWSKMYRDTKNRGET